MALPVSGNVIKGVLPNNGPGTQPLISQDQFGAEYVSELHAKYASLALTGSVFGAQWAAGATAAASATAVGLFGLFNPAGSGKNLVILDIIATLSTIAATANTTYIAGLQPIPNQTPTSQTATTVISNAMVGNTNASIAKALTAGTVVGAPTSILKAPFSWYSDLVASGFLAAIRAQEDGGIIIAPNSTLAVVSVVGTPTILLSALWAEVPV